jgi:hypothetical protein
MMSIGGWKGTLQLFRNPHYWEKTVHGLCEKVSNRPPHLFGDVPDSATECFNSPLSRKKEDSFP